MWYNGIIAEREAIRPSLFHPRWRCWFESSRPALFKNLQKMNPNSICAAENEVLRARLKRNKELAAEVRYALQATWKENRDAEVLEKLNEIINGK